VLAQAAPGAPWKQMSNGTSVGAMKIDVWAANVNVTALQLVMPGVPVGVTLDAFYCAEPTN
jgi:hypothetical protein